MSDVQRHQDAHVLSAGTVGNVLLVANYPSDVGYAWWLMESYWRNIAEVVSAQGRRTYLVYPKVNTVPAQIADSPIEIVEQTINLNSTTSIGALLRLVRDKGITGIYFTDRPYMHPAYLLLRLAGVRSLVVHDHTPGERPPVAGVRGGVKAILHRARLFSCDMFVATTEYIRGRMVGNARVPRSMTVVVPNGITTVAGCDGERERAREALGVAEHEIVVGIVGRAHSIKGIDFAVEVLALLRNTGRDAALRFVFIGDGPHRADFESLAARLGVEDAFTFLGARSDARTLMYGFDIGFHPSRGEVGYCLAILELMAAGLPVVVPRLDSVAGATVHGDTGMTYPAEDAAAAADTIALLASNREERTRMGMRAAVAVRDRYSLERAFSVLRSDVASVL